MRSPGRPKENAAREGAIGKGGERGRGRAGAGGMRRAWLLCALVAALAVTGAVLDPRPLMAASAGFLIAIAAVGAAVAGRRPDNPSGWLLCVIALSFSGTVAGDTLYTETGWVYSAWFTSWFWVPAMVSVATFPLVFPTGRVLSGRWRWVLWGVRAGGLLVLIGAAFSPGELEDYGGLQNPLGIEVVGELGSLAFFVLMAALFASISSMVVRFRRSRGVERQQLKWVTSAAAMFPFTLIAPVDEDGGFLLLLAGVFLIALAVAVAILRYRLYDIDLVIRRTLVYAALTATLAAIYLVSVLALQLVLPERSDFAVAVSTLAAAGLFVPARRRIQGVVDRRFFRARYDAQQTLEAFSGRLRDEVDLDLLSADLRAVAAQTMQPAHLSLWVRP